jgi:hypothetical protein
MSEQFGLYSRHAYLSGGDSDTAWLQGFTNRGVAEDIIDVCRLLNEPGISATGRLAHHGLKWANLGMYSIA